MRRRRCRDRPWLAGGTDRSSWVEPNIEVPKAARDYRLVVCQVTSQYFDGGELLAEVGVGLLGFQAGQRCAEAGVNSLPESEVLVGPAGRIELLRSVEEFRVVVGAMLDQQHAVVLFDLLAVQLESLCGPTGEAADRSVETQDFFDR